MDPLVGDSAHVKHTGSGKVRQSKAQAHSAYERLQTAPCYSIEKAGR